MGPRPPAPTAAERDLFRAALRDVRPLRNATRSIQAEPETLPAPVAAPPAAKSLPPKPSAPAPPPPNPGVDRGTVARLRKGEIPIERRIDLHGLTQDDAHAALDRFVRNAWTDGKRMLLVITGKGRIGIGGVLRSQVPRWLAAGEHAARVLRVEPAQLRHGGAGAYYVLLRRRRDAP